MEDEELLNFILERLYEVRFQEGGILSIRNLLNENEIYFRKNQLNRVMADMTTNGFANIYMNDDDYQAELSAEGQVYCEDILLMR